MKVVLSEHNLKTQEGFEQVFNVAKIFVHNFSYKTFNNDIMLIKVQQKSMQPGIIDLERGALETLFMFGLYFAAEQAGSAQCQRPASCSA